MDAATLAALARDQVIDITTTGRTSGQPRRLEIWYHRVDGHYYLSGWPGRRDWVANLEVDPALIFHLKQSIVADLPAHGVFITDPAERRRIMAHFAGRDLEEWLAGSPLVEVVFD